MFIFQKKPNCSWPRGINAIVVGLCPNKTGSTRAEHAVHACPADPASLGNLGRTDTFTSFALLGFYSALAPSLLQKSLGVESHAVGGAVIFELYAAAVLVLALTHWLGARPAMLSGLSLLLPSLAFLVVAFQAHSLPLLLIGAGLGGGAAALGYRGSLQIVNQIAPDSRRAQVVSSYLMFCYAGVSLPVIGLMSSPGKDAVIRRKQSWAQLMSSPRASDLAPVTSRVGRRAP